MPGAGNGLYYSGSTLHVGAGTGISVGSDNVNIRYPTYSCSSGYALNSISLINGGKSCVPVGGGGGGLTCYTWSEEATIKSCPSGYTMTGGGCLCKHGFRVFSSRPYSNGWECVCCAGSTCTNGYVYVRCCKIQ